jgi:hypothetical protein
MLGQLNRRGRWSGALLLGLCVGCSDPAGTDSPDPGTNGGSPSPTHAGASGATSGGSSGAASAGTGGAGSGGGTAGAVAPGSVDLTLGGLNADLMPARDCAGDPSVEFCIALSAIVNGEAVERTCTTYQGSRVGKADDPPVLVVGCSAAIDSQDPGAGRWSIGIDVSEGAPAVPGTYEIKLGAGDAKEPMAVGESAAVIAMDVLSFSWGDVSAVPYNSNLEELRVSGTVEPYDWLGCPAYRLSGAFAGTWLAPSAACGGGPFDVQCGEVRIRGSFTGASDRRCP